MNANDLYAMGIGGCAIAFVNAMLWLGQWASERRWRFVSSDTRRAWCLHRMWLNFLLALVFAAAAAAGWWMRA